ncbi:Phthiotriol/phenolphthiotriol dimycocerosates methyltransferase [Saezia sanguinis]|uniref:Phthiotriol/phenolphthiotriol dimycocerosates methyltransferase n=1 Tax=Saezia sanguinis TaxID=1965230 RepID=A0A433SDA3_9BURK|nr:class I SAM-dependent methyltransferase [Saezia sanguinis]RUS66614.1 Phthiotriol/phenolphthiotriol dimycocerosates methyltransferase [Saezia sanguinis]
MKENKYDDAQFFSEYSQMSRSVQGLEGAGEWHVFRQLFPELKGKRVLDLGCGFGWHCQYAAQQGAQSVIGTDISDNMLCEALRKNAFPNVQYERVAMEDIVFPDASFDVVISSLAFHYVASFDDICARVYQLLTPGGDFVFSVEHPVFTAQGTQNWYDDAQGKHLHWPVDRYFSEGLRQACFLGQEVTKYHKTLTTYINALLQTGFRLMALVEPEPDPRLLAQHPEYQDELRRPMFLLLSARK